MGTGELQEMTSLLNCPGTDYQEVDDHARGDSKPTKGWSFIPLSLGAERDGKKVIPGGARGYIDEKEKRIITP